MANPFTTEYNQLYEDCRSCENIEYMGEEKEHEEYFLENNRSRFRRFVNLIDIEPGDRILDIGTSTFTILLNRLFPSCDVMTVDVTDRLQNRVEREGIEFRVCDIVEDDLPFSSGSFDLIIFAEVLEHLFADPYQVINTVSNGLADGGELIFGTPNFLRLKNRFLIMLGRNPLKLSPPGTHGFNHVREYSMNECVKLIRNCGLNIDTKEHTMYKSFGEFIRWHSKSRHGEWKPPLILESAFYYSLTQLSAQLKTYILIKAIK